MVSDNGKQFADNPVKTWCQELHISQIFTSVAHPQGNGQVERANRSIVDGIKTRITQEGSNWVEELPHVLWAHRTMHKTSNVETPFSLTYGSEAVIPAEIGLPSPGVLEQGSIDNDKLLRQNLDMLEERREVAAIKEAKYKGVMERYYNKNCRPYVFKVGEYVFRDNQASKSAAQGKLGVTWEGPYRVQKVHGKGTYTLESLAGVPLPRTWNSAQLRKCYI